MKSYFVHRLVAEAFIPNSNNLPCINHKDENPSNNDILNLEWCDYKYNNNYGTRTQKCIIKQGKKVNQYDLQHNFIKQWNSLREIERELKFQHSIISNCCKGKRQTAYGYKWKYKDTD